MLLTAGQTTKFPQRQLIGLIIIGGSELLMIDCHSL
jgi:hypothetical protein